MEIKKIAAVDFDGVIHEYFKWEGPEAKGKIIIGSDLALYLLQEAGYHVTIFSARPRKNIIKWFNNKSMMHLIDEVTNVKPPFTVLFDDRAFGSPVKTNKSNALYFAVRKYLRNEWKKP